MLTILNKFGIDNLFCVKRYLIDFTLGGKWRGGGLRSREVRFKLALPIPLKGVGRGGGVKSRKTLKLC